ncbi:hypothetical protein LCGC14_1948600 [marine sediment metagenome]|uniref:Proliferating cell nuclear antigen PCNA N-terminal domain-containing protein n=1 Tax=marine sediment metagenome TaxID=412755 RepID=A0A0F9FIF0_9ZZZZ
MLVKTKDFASFLKVLNLKGKYENTNALITFKKEGLEVLTVCPDTEVIALRGFLKIPYDGDECVVGLDNIGLLRTCVGNFEEEFNLTKTDNKLILSDKKLKISCILRNPAYVTTKLDNDKFKKVYSSLSEHSITLDISQIKKLINYFNTIGSNSIILTNKNNKLGIKSEKSENELSATIDTKVIEKFEIKLPKVFVDVLSIVDDDIILKLSDGKPGYIGISSEHYTFQILIQRRK